MGLALQHITRPSLTGKDEKGISTTLYYCRRSDILSIPDRDGVDFEGVATISGNIVFNTGAQFFELYSSREKGELRWNSEGENDAVTFKSFLEISLPKNSPNVLGFLEEMKNDDFVILARETCDRWRLLGDGCLPCKLDSAEGTTGKGSGDAKMVTAVFSSQGIAPIYTGDIQLAPAA